MRKLFLTVMLAAALGACVKDPDPETEKADKEAARAVRAVESMIFVRHPTARGLCIGYVFERRGGDGYGGVGGPAMVEVDCAKVEGIIVNGEATR